MLSITQMKHRDVSKYVGVLVHYAELPPKQIGGSSEIHLN